MSVICKRKERAMSIWKWAYEADTCDGEPCCGECDECPIKDEAIEHKNYVEENKYPTAQDAYKFDEWRNR